MGLQKWSETYDLENVTMKMIKQIKQWAHRRQIGSVKAFVAILLLRSYNKMWKHIPIYLSSNRKLPKCQTWSLMWLHLPAARMLKERLLCSRRSSMVTSMPNNIKNDSCFSGIAMIFQKGTTDMDELKVQNVIIIKREKSSVLWQRLHYFILWASQWMEW